MNLDPTQVRRYEPIEYDEMPGDMVTAESYDALLALYRDVCAQMDQGMNDSQQLGAIKRLGLEAQQLKGVGPAYTY